MTLQNRLPLMRFFLVFIPVLCFPVPCSFSEPAAEEIASVDSSANIPDLIEFLKSEDPAVRVWAAVRLGEIGSPAKEAVPALIQAIRRGDRGFRICAALAILKIDPMAMEAIPILMKSFRDGKLAQGGSSGNGFQNTGAESFMGMGEDMNRVWGALTRGELSKEVVAILLKELKTSNDRNIRSVAVVLVGTVWEKNEEVLPALVDALSDQDEEVRLSAAKVLEGIGPPAKEAVPVLSGLLKSKKDKDPLCAVSALMAIDPPNPEIILYLGRVMDDKQTGADLRLKTVSILKQVGLSGNRNAVQVLARGLSDSSPDVRLAVLKSFREMDPPAVEAVAALIPLLADEQDGVRSDAMLILMKIGSPAVRDLSQALKDPDQQIRSRAGFILENIGTPEAKAALFEQKEK